MSSQRLLVTSFLALVLLGTILLSFPVAYPDKKPIPLIDRIFTATSATCVTGLIVVDTGKDFSLFGQIIILTLIQVGGLGFMTFSSLLILLIAGKISLKEKIIIRESLSRYNISGIAELIKYVVIFTFTMELLATGLLYLFWKKYIPSPDKRFYYCLFHSISAFCNAGFSLFPDSLTRFGTDIKTVLVITGLIITGGLGFFVTYELRCLILTKLNSIQKIIKFKPGYKPLHISLHSKIVLIGTFILILTGLVFFILLEWNNTLYGESFGNKLLLSYFQSVTPRTAGFNTVDISKISLPTALVLIGLMFIGGAPGSTAGGTKITTGVVLFLTIKSFLKGEKDVTVFFRKINEQTVRRAIVIYLFGINLLLVSTFLILLFEGSKFTFLEVLFETTSAFGTVGLSRGITPMLSTPSKIIIILLMLTGRIGPLTIALSIFEKEEKRYKFIEEEVGLG